MAGLHDNQKKILDYLLDHPAGATLDELSVHLGVTRTAAKEHLVRVETLGYLTYEDRKGKVGRPRRHYRLTEQGHETFPRRYSWLSNVLLEFLTENLGPVPSARMMESIAAKVVESMRTRFQSARSTAALLAEVTGALNELGYRARLKQSDLRKGAVIEATNCVYHSVAKVHPELCKFDIKFIENATGGMNVKLESCIARGGSVCRFCIRKP